MDTGPAGRGSTGQIQNNMNMRININIKDYNPLSKTRVYESLGSKSKKGLSSDLQVDSQLTNIQGIMELEKSPFDNHHRNSWGKQGSSTDAETSGWKLEENGIFSLKVAPHHMLRGETVSLQWRNLVHST